MYSPENSRLRRGGGLCCDRRRACSGLDASSALEGYVHLGHSRCRHSDARFRVSPGQGVTRAGDAWTWPGRSFIANKKPRALSRRDEWREAEAAKGETKRKGGGPSK